MLDDCALQKSLSPWLGLAPHCQHRRAHCGFGVKRTASNSGCLVRNSDDFSIFLFHWDLKTVFLFFPSKPTAYIYIFMENSLIHLSNQHAMELICSSWSSWIVVAQAHVWGLNRESYQKGLVPSPCLQHLSHYLHTKPCNPSGCPSILSWVLGLGRPAAQLLMLLSFIPSLFLWVLSLEFADSQWEWFLHRPPITSPREPKLANPQRA